jgi:hypothetical protein
LLLLLFKESGREEFLISHLSFLSPKQILFVFEIILFIDSSKIAPLPSFRIRRPAAHARAR